jgi:predicted phage terminase large subunit-like protein
VGGTSTGEGGDLLIVDDPTNPEQAMSEVERTTANRWFDQTFLSRLNDRKTGRIIVVMQRLHMDDLTGHIIKKGGWTHVSLPLIAEAPTTYTFGKGRNETTVTMDKGDILHEARFPSAQMEQLKRDMGSYAFSAQYQQSPVPLEGGLIKHAWLKTYNAMPEGFQYDSIVQSWDTAVKASQLNDPSGCLTIGIKGNECHVLDYYEERLEYPDLKRMVVAMASRTYYGKIPEAVLMEDKASGQSLIQDLRRESSIPLIAITPTGEKIVRLSAESAKIEAGLMLLPAEAPWLAHFISQLCLFPAVAHDEVVDTVSQFLCWWGKRMHSGYRIRRL